MGTEKVVRHRCLSLVQTSLLFFGSVGQLNKSIAEAPVQGINGTKKKSFRKKKEQKRAPQFLMDDPHLEIRIVDFIPHSNSYLNRTGEVYLHHILAGIYFDIHRTKYISDFSFLRP